MPLSTYITVFVEHLIFSDLVLTLTLGHHHHVYDLRLLKSLALTEELIKLSGVTRSYSRHSRTSATP